MLLASPKSSDVLGCILHDDYIFPVVEMLYEGLIALKLPDEILKARFNSLLNLIIVKENISEASGTLIFSDDDLGLKKAIKQITGSEDDLLLNDLYVALFRLLHEFILNKSPDKQSDIDHNAEVAQKMLLQNLSREALFDETKPLLGTLLKRLEKYDSELTSERLRIRVLEAIVKAKETILTSPKKEEKEIDPLVSPPPAFVPAFKDPRFLKQRQMIEDEALAEQLAREFQEEEDRQAALALQQQFSDDEEDDVVDDDDEAVLDNDADTSPGNRRTRAL